jgi:folate-binding protein YgfZ
MFGAASVERRLGLPAGSAGGAEAVLVDVPAWSAGALLRLLRMYRLRRPVEVEDVSADFTAWQLFPPAEEAARAPPVPSSGPADAGAAAWFPDPRLPALGFRALVPAGEVPPGGAEGGGDCGAFRALRYTLGVAEGDREMPSGEALPLECNLDALNGVSYSKGCYVGQELTARTHFKGIIRKRLMPVTLSGDGASPGDAVRLEGGGRRVGKLLAAEGARGLALLRLRPVLEAAACGEACVVEGSGVLLTARRPAWWPGGWGHEEDD